MNTDVKAVRVTATGSVRSTNSRIHAIHVLTGGTGPTRLTITDGSGGSTALDMDFDVSDSNTVSIPLGGIRVPNGIFVSTLNNITGMTIFYTG